MQQVRRHDKIGQVVQYWLFQAFSKCLGRYKVSPRFRILHRFIWLVVWGCLVDRKMSHCSSYVINHKNRKLIWSAKFMYLNLFSFCVNKSLLISHSIAHFESSAKFLFIFYQCLLRIRKFCCENFPLGFRFGNLKLDLAQLWLWSKFPSEMVNTICKLHPRNIVESLLLIYEVNDRSLQYFVLFFACPWKNICWRPHFRSFLIVSFYVLWNSKNTWITLFYHEIATYMISLCLPTRHAMSDSTI